MLEIRSAMHEPNSPYSQQTVNRAQEKFGAEFRIKYLVYYPKTTLSRADAWDEARKAGRARKFDVIKKHNYYGWRKCHSQDHWAWYAYDRKRKRIWAGNLQKFFDALLYPKFPQWRDFPPTSS